MCHNVSSSDTQFLPCVLTFTRTLCNDILRILESGGRHALAQGGNAACGRGPGAEHGGRAGRRPHLVEAGMPRIQLFPSRTSLWQVPSTMSTCRSVPCGALRCVLGALLLWQMHMHVVNAEEEHAVSDRRTTRGGAWRTRSARSCSRCWCC